MSQQQPEMKPNLPTAGNSNASTDAPKASPAPENKTPQAQVKSFPSTGENPASLAASLKKPAQSSAAAKAPAASKAQAAKPAASTAAKKTIAKPSAAVKTSAPAKQTATAAKKPVVKSSNSAKASNATTTKSAASAKTTKPAAAQANAKNTFAHFTSGKSALTNAQNEMSTRAIETVRGMLDNLNSGVQEMTEIVRQARQASVNNLNDAQNEVVNGAQSLTKLYFNALKEISASKNPADMIAAQTDYCRAFQKTCTDNFRTAGATSYKLLREAARPVSSFVSVFMNMSNAAPNALRQQKK